MPGRLNMIKLCVGAEAVEDLALSQTRRADEARAAGRDAAPSHVTRMLPKRGDELLDGGSLYWVFKGLVLARQRIVSLTPRDGADGIRRCAIGFDAEIVRTVPQPRRPFQGWRYLRAEDVPRDLMGEEAASDLPPALMAELAAIGVL